jgi:hypothetical protein
MGWNARRDGMMMMHVGGKMFHLNRRSVDGQTEGPAADRLTKLGKTDKQHAVIRAQLSWLCFAGLLSMVTCQSAEKVATFSPCSLWRSAMTWAMLNQYQAEETKLS